MRTLNRAIYIFLCALPLVLICFACGKYMLLLALSIAIHEIGHLAILKLLKGRIRAWRPAPFGLCIDFDQSSLSLVGEMAVSLGGVLFNLIFALISLLICRYTDINLSDFAIVSLALAMLNLIPVTPLDGGRIMGIIAEVVFGQRIAMLLTSILAYIFGFVIFLVFSYSLLTSQSGIYPLLFSVYIFACNSKTLGKAVFQENESI